MFFLPIALVTAGAAALLNFWLGLRVSRLRMSEKIMVGDGGNPRLLARMRAQLNFAEYAPLVLILIALVELARGTQAWLWGVALLFIVGRVLHAFGMDGWKPGRMIGIATTMLTMLGLAAYAVFLGYTGLNPLR
jgi:uncharacterized membrane protein YecN with MAPEG domain